MYKLYMDGRGHAAGLFISYLNRHPNYKKEFQIVVKNNQKQDIIAYHDDTPVAYFELKIENDLESSLSNNRLKSELNEYILDANENNIDYIFLICAGQFNTLQYTWLNSLMNTHFPGIRFFLPYTVDKMVEKVIKILKGGCDQYRCYIPTLVRPNSLKKDFSLSIASLMNGISENIAFSLADHWYADITEKEIFDIINKTYDNNKEHGELAYKIYTKIQNTWLRKEDDVE